jgi:hypothetical protein
MACWRSGRPTDRFTERACAAVRPALTQAQNQRLQEALKDMPRTPGMERAVQEIEQHWAARL